MNDFYKLLKLPSNAPIETIHIRCVEMMKEWNTHKITKKLPMGPIKAVTYAPTVQKHGVYYLSLIASILLDPTSRECYDLWLESTVNVEKRALCNQQIDWFNQNARLTPIRFGIGAKFETVLKQEEEKVQKKRKYSHTFNCRFCSLPFDNFKVLQCNCTARIGHVGCADAFAVQMNNKCPVCRTDLVQKSTLSKYLFWSQNRKWKLIT